jgi:hypothetical protein
MKHGKKILFATLLCILPLSVSAVGFPDLRSFVGELLSVNAILLNILVTIAFVIFFWGVAKFILAAGDSKALAEGKQFMFWGVIALFVLLSWLAIIKFFSGQFEFGGNTDPIQLPTNDNYSIINYPSINDN